MSSPVKRIINSAVRIGAVAVLFIGSSASARPLGIEHIMDDGVAQFDLSFRSDLWTTPNAYKENPLRIYDLIFRYPVFENDTWKILFQGETEGLRIGHAGLSVGERKLNIGGDLRSQSFAMTFSKKGSDQSETKIFTGYSSDSEVPFKDQRDVAMDVTAFHFLPTTNKWQWVAGLDKTKNRGFLNDKIIPLLGVTYLSDSGFKASAGFPYFSLAWSQFNRSETLILTPSGLAAVIQRELSTTLKLFLRGGITNRAYLHTSRDSDRDRLFFEERYIEFAARKTVSENSSLESSIGYAFERRLYEAEEVFRPRGEVIAIKPDIYGQLSMRFLF